MKENTYHSLPGIPVLLGLLVSMLLAVYLIIGGADAGNVLFLIVGVLVIVGAVLCLVGLYMVEPNQAAVLNLFGKYVGTCLLYTSRCV